MRWLFTISCWMFIVGAAMTQSLEGNAISKSRSSISMSHVVNLTSATQPGSQTLGGQFELFIAHQLRNSQFGFGTGIAFHLLNVGRSKGFLQPTLVDHFKAVELPFSVFYYPIQDIPFQIEAGLAYVNFCSPIVKYFPIHSIASGPMSI